MGGTLNHQRTFTKVFCTAKGFKNQGEGQCGNNLSTKFAQKFRHHGMYFVSRVLCDR